MGANFLFDGSAGSKEMLKLFLLYSDEGFRVSPPVYMERFFADVPGEPIGDLCALARYEREHRAYMEGPFFREEGGVLFVEAREGRYLAAVKLYPWKEPGCWHVEALETRPEERGKGHGARVLGGAVRTLEEIGNVIVLSDVAKTNEASLRTHLRCGFRREAEQWTEADGTVTDRRCTMVYRGGEADKGRI